MSSEYGDAQLGPSQTSASPLGRPGRVYEDDPESDATKIEEAWKRKNLLSLGRPLLSLLLRALLTNQLIDGGGIRGIWTLLTLERLMDHVGRVEEAQEGHDEDGYIGDGRKTCSSFLPLDYPKNVSHVHPKEQQRSGRQSSNHACDSISRSRRYLPCHYFDYIGGSSTGA